MINTIQFPWWVRIPIGVPLLLESDFEDSIYPNVKWGGLLDGTSTLTKDSVSLYWGGKGSIEMKTDNVSNHASELKISFFNDFVVGEYIVLEQKWLTAFNFSSTEFQTGIESRTNNVVQGRFRYSKTLLKWQYESAVDIYSDFPNTIGGVLNIKDPFISSTSGSKAGMTRVIIDPINRKYVGFQASGLNGLETRDMRSLNIPLIDRGDGTADYTILCFTMTLTKSNNAEKSYTTDWCISRIPVDIDPFTGLNRKLGT